MLSVVRFPRALGSSVLSEHIASRAGRGVACVARGAPCEDASISHHWSRNQVSNISGNHSGGESSGSEMVDTCVPGCANYGTGVGGAGEGDDGSNTRLRTLSNAPTSHPQRWHYSTSPAASYAADVSTRRRPFTPPTFFSCAGDPTRRRRGTNAGRPTPSDSRTA